MHIDYKYHKKFKLTLHISTYELNYSSARIFHTRNYPRLVSKKIFRVSIPISRNFFNAFNNIHILMRNHKSFLLIQLFYF